MRRAEAVRRLTRAQAALEGARASARALAKPVDVGTPEHRAWSAAWTAVRLAAIDLAVVEAQCARAGHRIENDTA